MRETPHDAPVLDPPHRVSEMVRRPARRCSQLHLQLHYAVTATTAVLSAHDFFIRLIPQTVRHTRRVVLAVSSRRSIRVRASFGVCVSSLFPVFAGQEDGGCDQEQRKEEQPPELLDARARARLSVRALLLLCAVGMRDIALHRRPRCRAGLCVPSSVRAARTCDL